MSATSIYFNGRMTRIPGSYSEVDASALESIGLAASGYVACVGTSYGGKPFSAVDVNDIPGTLQASTRPGKAKTYFQDGDLLDAEDLLFAPANEESVAGAQKIYWVKVNKSAASSAIFNNGGGAALKLTSADYGYHTTRINVQIATGTTVGKKFTIVFDDTTEVIDNLGGNMFSAKYLASTPANGFTTITLAVTALKTEAAFTRTRTGLDTDITNQVALGGYLSAQVEFLSSAAGDTTQTVTLYGVDGTGVAVVESLACNGTSVVTSVRLYNKIHGAKISAAPAGTVTIRNLSAGTSITTLTAAAMTKALGLCTDMPVAGTLNCKADAGCTNRVTIVGRNVNGVLQAETVTLNGTNNVPTTGSWTYVDYMAVGELVVARTLTLSGVAGSGLYSGGYDTLQKQLDYYNSKDGFEFIALSGALNFLMVNMDIYTATNIKTTLANFGADLYWIITGINNSSALVTAERQSPGTTSPSNTTTPVYLAGGNEGSATPGLEGTPTASHADWEDALDLLKQLYVNTIVVLTADPSVHADLKSHIAYMCGAGRMERDGVVGIMNAGQTGRATKTEVKTQIIALNTRHLRVVAQQCERYDSDGVKTKMNEPFAACLVAGAQAGTEVGTSLTRKYINTLGMYGDSSWNPKDDADELIEAGLMFAEQVDGKGNRWVRNITSHLSTSNIAYTEGSVNQAVNYSVYNFRTEMELMVGEKGFAGTVQAADGRARNKLDLLMDEVLTGWRSLLITILSDVMEVAVEMSPIIPINFVKNYVHLYLAPISAAA